MYLSGGGGVATAAVVCMLNWFNDKRNDQWAWFRFECHIILEFGYK